MRGAVENCSFFPLFFFLFPSVVTLTKIIFEVHAGYLPAVGLEEIKIVRVRQRKYNFLKVLASLCVEGGRNARAELRGHQTTDPCLY